MRTEMIVQLLLSAAGIYCMLGLLFAVPFVLRGAAKIDPHAASGTWGFKVMIFPASVMFWPLLLRRWMTGQSEPPQECSAHRTGTCPKRTGKQS